MTDLRLHWDVKILRVLILESNDLGDEGAKYLAVALEVNQVRSMISI